MALPAIRVDFDDGGFGDNLTAKAFGDGARRGVKIGLAELQSRIRQGFDVGGWDPETGKAGAWAKRVIPKDMDADTKRKDRSAKAKNGQAARLRIGGKVLVNTGRLRDSIVASSPKRDANGYSGFVGTNVPYAKYHQFGASYKASKRQAGLLRAMGFKGVKEGSTINLPKREIFVMPDDWQVEVTEIIADELMRSIEEK